MSVKVGILGLAHGHVMTYGKKWIENPAWGIELVGAWDHDAERLAKNTETLGIAAYETPEELLELVDAVVISSETSFHVTLTELAAAAGKDIICYKPMALTLDEADRMVEAVEASGVRFTLGYQMRVDPQNIKMKELVQSGTIGEICHYRRRHGLSVHMWPGFENAWHTQEHYNRDIFADDSAHPIDMLNWLFGVPETVSCEMTTMANLKIKNNNGVALFRYANGLIAEITCSFTCVASEITTEIYGTRGSIQQYYGDAVSTRLPRPEGQPGLKYYVNGDEDWTDSGIASPAAHGERIAAQGEVFAQFLRGERGPICSVYEARDSLKMVLACYVSAREGRRVRIDDIDLYNVL
ncbi:MAG: Gfo/Idh/MocA family oxidoreductase [Ruminococcaceae bacterium]|nr:Gfo/Idh/MocA family oxidoreductase [Oscillospiraceae bacterium]